MDEREKQEAQENFDRRSADMSDEMRHDVEEVARQYIGQGVNTFCARVQAEQVVRGEVDSPYPLVPTKEWEEREGEAIARQNEEAEKGGGH